VTTERVYDNEAILQDPAFKALMSKRSRLRWGMTTVIVIVYLGYGFAGLYFPEVMALPSFGTSMPWVMSLGYLITVLSIVLSIAYIHIVGGLTYDADNAGVDQQ
jgi:uncharacterized membrane protein (DUF485 family)